MFPCMAYSYIFLYLLYTESNNLFSSEKPLSDFRNCICGDRVITVLFSPNSGFYHTWNQGKDSVFHSNNFILLNIWGRFKLIFHSLLSNSVQAIGFCQKLLPPVESRRFSAKWK